MEKNEKALLTPQFLFTLISVTMFLSTYYIMMPVLPLYMKDMGGNNFVIGLIMGIFSVFSLVLRPISGKLSDRSDPVFLMRLSIFVFFLTPLCFLKSSFVLIGAAQILYGFTVGMFTTASGLVVTMSVKEDLISQAIGYHSITIILAKGMAPTFGSWLFLWAGIEAALTATVVLAAASLICVFYLKPMKPKSTEVKNNFSALAVFAKKTVWMPSLVLLSITITFGAIMTMLPLFAHERGIDNFNLFFTINTAMVVFVRIVISNGKFSKNMQIFSSLAALSLAVFVLAFCNSLALLLIIAIVYGYGYGLSYPALTSIVVLRNDPAARGTVFGSFTAFFDAGVALGAALAGLSEYLGFTAIYIAISCVPALGAVIFFLLLGHIKKDIQATEQ